MNLSEIKELSYNYETNIMTIHLTHKKLYKNYMRDFINFKCDEKTFIEKCNIWLEFKKDLKIKQNLIKEM